MLSYLSYFIGPVGQWIFIFLVTFPITFLLTHIFLKKKNISLFQKIGIYLIVCFLFLAFGLVLFPFPDFSNWFCEARAGIQVWQFVPFQFLQDINTFAQKHQVSLLRNKALFQVIFNIFLILPIGFLGALFFKWWFWKTFLLGFLISFSFEIIQWTGIFGILPCPYRLFDIDDLMLNTSGAILWFLAILPFRKSLQNYFEQKEFIVKRENFLIKRAFAFVLDFIFVNIIFSLLAFLWNIWLYNYYSFTQIFAVLDYDFQKILFNFLQFFLYFVVLWYFLKWQTFWKKILWLKIISVKSKNLTFRQIFIRSIIPIFSFSIFSIFTYFFQKKTGIILDQNGVYAILYFTYLWIFIPLSMELSIDWRALHDKMWGTKVIKLEK